jgi:hypothetical protein
MSEANSRIPWTREQLMLSFRLYCQLPFGKLHARNPEIVELARLIGRTPSAVTMKLVNFASLDPSITQTGRRGLANSSVADRATWEEFNSDWGGLNTQCEDLLRKLSLGHEVGSASVLGFAEAVADYVGEEREAIVSLRQRQNFFRRAVLASYEGKCCMSGVTTGALIVASHIVPWAEDEKNRLNPRNGLCLSAIHDRAFDRGLITVTPDLTVRVSRQIQQEGERTKLGRLLSNIDRSKIQSPKRFMPSPEFLRWHNDERFEKLNGTTGDI